MTVAISADEKQVQMKNGFPSAIDKFEECQYFLAMMLLNYHDPLAFRFNLNAFIQSFRNVTFMIQSEEDKPPGFEEWYKSKQFEMRKNVLLRRFADARNLIVKQQMLETKSKCSIGLFRGRKMKLAIVEEVPPCVATNVYLERGKTLMVGFFIDKEHSAIDEQIGVERRWVVDAIGDDEVVSYCALALREMGTIIKQAIELGGGVFNPIVELPDLKPYMVLLESDVDPSLLEKWGW